MKRKTLVLFDAHAILHRAYHALPDFTTQKGEPTGALYGLSTLLFKTIDTFHPDGMAACYDLPGGTFRDKVYKEYKGKRPETDPALVEQLQTSRKIFEAFGIPVYDAKGFEADDVIGTIAEKAKKTNDVIIVSGDMDTLQLVDGDRVKVFTLKKGIGDTVIYDEEKVKERFGFSPALLPDYKGLRGDPSDNIIGVPKIGEKTATILISTFGTIEEMYQMLKKSDGDQKFQKAGISPRIIGILREHEEDAKFSKLLATIRRDAPTEFSEAEVHAEKWDKEKTKALFRELEFQSLVRRIDQLNGVVSEEPTEEKHEEAIPEDVLDRAKILLWLIDSDNTNPSEEDFRSLPGTTVEEKFAHLENEINNAGLDKVYREIELPLVPILRKAEEKGILVDTKELKRLSALYHEKLDEAAKTIYEHAGKTFNINSPKQLGEILFDELKLTAKGLRKTEGGARSTRESELEKLRDLHPIIPVILDYRELQKLLSTYIDTIPTLIGKDGRLHTTFHQTGSTTGRMSSKDPNLQNIPVGDGLGGAIRNAFIAPEGSVLIACDYSQIEMRVLAILSEDPALLEIFRNNEDVHTSVAARVFRVRPENVTHDMRRRAKVINFGIIYGMGISALQRALGSTRTEAEAFYQDYLGAFPRAAAYLSESVALARKQGYTQTAFGRRRYVPDIKSRIPYLRASAERIAMNAPLQGTAADFIKLAMVRSDRILRERGLLDRVHLLLQVHDELVFECADEKALLKKGVEAIRTAMEEVYPECPIPLSISVKIGNNWGTMKEFPF